MKAHEILMFLLILNLVFWLLGGYGLNLYNLNSYKSDINTNILEDRTKGNEETVAEYFLYDLGHLHLHQYY